MRRRRAQRRTAWHPVQLAQVSQGSHPLGAGPSMLEHLLGEHHTVPPDRGVFLDISYRMHPEICAFISCTVYDGRLHAAATAANRVIADTVVHGRHRRSHAV
jgi:superfamily I DNA and/or RNA helicase